jgi:hypothetical protein
MYAVPGETSDDPMFVSMMTCPMIQCLYLSNPASVSVTEGLPMKTPFPVFFVFTNFFIRIVVDTKEKKKQWLPGWKCDWQKDTVRLIAQAYDKDEMEVVDEEDEVHLPPTPPPRPPCRPLPD